MKIAEGPPGICICGKIHLCYFSSLINVPIHMLSKMRTILHGVSSLYSKLLMKYASIQPDLVTRPSHCCKRNYRWSFKGLASDTSSYNQLSQYS